MEPHVTDTIRVAEGPPKFPLKAEYDRVNSTLEERKEADARYGKDDFPIPPDAPEPQQSATIDVVSAYTS